MITHLLVAMHVVCFVVPVNTLLLSVVGSRVLSAIGCVLVLIGVITSAFPSQIWHLVISLSIIGGK